jgi:DHA1 family multidrug resistance protein-like MFS transporter
MQILKTPNKNVAFATLSAATFLLVVNMFAPFLAPYLIQHGFNDGEISYISSLAPLAIVLLTPLFGSLSDSLGRKAIQRFSLILYALALLSYLFVGHNYVLLIVAVVLSTLTSEVYLETTSERIQDNLPLHRGEYTGISDSLQSLGALIGTVFATYIISILPIATILQLSLILILILFAAGFLVPKSSKKSVTQKRSGTLEGFKKFWAQKELRSLSVLSFATSFHHPAVTIFIALFIIQDLHADLRFVGLAAGSLLIGHLFRFLGGYSCELFGAGKTAIRAVILCSLAFIALGFAANVWVVILLAFLIGLTGAFWSTSSVCFLSEIGEKLEMEGVFVGTYTSITYLAVFISFLVSGVIANNLGIRTLFIFYGLFALVISLFVGRNIRKTASFK